METDGAKEGVRLWDLRSSNCHWPLGGLLEHVEFFCGEPTVPGCPYCREHRKRAFVRTHAVQKRDRSAAETRPKDPQAVDRRDRSAGETRPKEKSPATGR